MAKIMLVEDDKSLREIYGVRLLAEGYEIISAGDGEEALAMAVKEKPDLILSDVMMPKISGFDMLDILRSTPETKEIKVIMMTALSSEDQRARGESLGANRYLVKSQVGIEDVVRTVHDVLSDTPELAPATPRFGTPTTPVAVNPPQQPAAQPATPIVQVTVSTSQPVAPASAPAISTITPDMSQPAVAQTPQVTPAPVQTAPVPTPVPATPAQPTYAPSPVVEAPVAVAVPVPVQIVAPPVPTPQPAIAVPAPVLTPAPIAPPSPVSVPPSSLPQPTAPFSTSAPQSLGDLIIQPLTPTEPQPDMNAMIEQELHDGSATNPLPPAAPPQ